MLSDSNSANILSVLDLVKRETDTPRQQKNNGGGISLENLCSKKAAVLGFSVDVERGIEKYGLIETVSMSPTFTVNQFNFNTGKICKIAIFASILPI